MIRICNLNKTFHLKTGDVTALDDVSLQIEDGSVYGVIGYSGAGKSTLVRCLNLLETPDSGSIAFDDDGEVVLRGGKIYLKRDGAERRMTEKQLNGMRRGIGMIFQHFNLLDRSTVFENIAYPLRYSGMSADAVSARVKELLALVDLSDKTNVYPSQLSGGQKQRVAIARALANNPKVLLSDEATSALDPDATEAILNLLRDLNKKLGLTIILITHEMAVIKSVCHRVAVMEEGKVVEEGTVYEIFSHPQAPITRKFISSASPLGKIGKMIEEQSALVRLKPGEKLVKLTFLKECVGDHIITSAVKKNNADLSIVLANVDSLDEGPLGGLIGKLSGSDEAVAATIAYLEENHVDVEVLDNAAAL